MATPPSASFGCPTTTSRLNQYTIRLIEGGGFMCSVSVIPPGFVILNAYYSTDCLTAPDGPNHYRVLPVTNPAQVCSKIVPPGYVVISAISTSNRPTSPLGLNLYNIRLPGLTDTVCSVSTIPSNYRVVGTGSVSNCPGPGPNTKRIQRI